MAGIPHHAVERYCVELIRRGCCVALCDYGNHPGQGALLKRDITRVLTPGTVLEEGLLSARRNNWLAAVVVEGATRQTPFRWGLVSADVSTGEVKLMQRQGSDNLHQELSRLDPSELLWSEPGDRPAWCPDRLQLTPMTSTPFSRPEAEQALLLHYQLATIDGLGLQDLPLALRATGGLLAYLRDTQPLEENNRVPLERPQILHRGDALVLDAQTRRNLELTATQRDGQFQGSLLWAIDRSLTAMGGRSLRRWIEAPLMQRTAIEARQQLIGRLVDQRSQRQAIRRLLRPMGDLERLAGRAGAGHAGARDLVAIADGLERLPRLATLLENDPAPLPDGIELLQALDPTLSAVASSIREQLLENALSLNEERPDPRRGDLLLDGLRNQLDDQDAWLAQQEQQERRLSGNNNLRLQHVIPRVLPGGEQSQPPPCRTTGSAARPWPTRSASSRRT